MNNTSDNGIRYRYLLYEFLRLVTGFCCIIFILLFTYEIGKKILDTELNSYLTLFYGLSANIFYFLCLYFINLKNKIVLE